MTHFVDTNLVVYAYSDDAKAPRAREVLEGAIISVQVLNEFANVSIRKLARSEAKLEYHIASILNLTSRVVDVDEEIHHLARAVAYRYKVSFYDAALLSAALLSGCDIFFSEDMQNGLVIEGAVTIRNPFV